MNPLIQWIADGLAKPGKKKGGLARVLGRSGSMVTLMLQGKRQVKADELPKIAKYIEEPLPPSLYEFAEERSHAAEPPIADLPIVGTVEAGAWREVENVRVPKRSTAAARDPNFPEAEQFLLRVSGDSMNAATPTPICDGALIRCVSWADTGMMLRNDLLVVVERRDAGGQRVETTVKRVKVTRQGYELHPESTNPKHKPIIIPRNDEHHEVSDVETVVRALVTAVIYEL